ncbi:hypothetical protein GQ54DRAFT_217675 [Martensiomyces pterosporus]|nr:hypothetical protein GQ54DRAFT_217675 [Martensiomyces pterosporus]
MLCLFAWRWGRSGSRGAFPSLLPARQQPACERVVFFFFFRWLFFPLNRKFCFCATERRWRGGTEISAWREESGQRGAARSAGRLPPPPPPSRLLRIDSRVLCARGLESNQFAQEWKGL